MMLNTLDDYIWRSLPEWGDFATNPNLRKKADDSGKLLPYRGNTVVFLLDDGTRAALKALQRELYDAAGWMLAEPLTEDTFHMTLHDLENGPVWDDTLPQRMIPAGEKAAAILAQWKDQPPLKMKATWMFNMVSTSIVLGLAPRDDDSCRRLSEMYEALEQVRPLGYALTPHITLAYYRPGVYDQGAVSCLRAALRPVELETELRLRDLVVQTFEDMNHYAAVCGKWA